MISRREASSNDRPDSVGRSGKSSTRDRYRTTASPRFPRLTSQRAMRFRIQALVRRF
jgi:hypothetical protein